MRTLIACLILTASSCSHVPVAAQAPPQPQPEKPLVVTFVTHPDHCEGERGCLLISRAVLAAALQQAREEGAKAAGSDGRTCRKELAT